MNLTGNTIFITGGGSGIGRALAEELHKRGNKVIISGRRKSHLDSVAKANPGIEAIELDIADLESIKAVAKKLITEHRDLNVLINNAGIMEPDHAAGVIDDRLLVSTVTTNLLGPIRLTSALVDQLKSRRGVILYNTSVLAFVPMAVTAKRMPRLNCVNDCEGVIFDLCGRPGGGGIEIETSSQLRSSDWLLGPQRSWSERRQLEGIDISSFPCERHP